MHQEKLFRLAVEAGTINFHHEAGSGWVLVIKLRRGAELWDESVAECYDHLTTVELIDTIYAHLDSAL